MAGNKVYVSEYAAPVDFTCIWKKNYPVALVIPVKNHLKSYLSMGAEKRVQVYDADTDEVVMEFESVKACAAYFGVDSSYISNNIRGKTKTIKNRQYYCKAVDKVYHTTVTANFGNKPPRAIDVFEDGDLLATYDNVKLAANATGVNPWSIYQYCTGARKKPIKGYTFRYNKERQMEISRYQQIYMMQRVMSFLRASTI